MVMALYSNSNISIYDEKDRSKQAMVEDFWQRSNDQWQAYQWEANTDTKYFNGDFSVFSQVYNLPASQIKQFSYNNIRPLINMVDGYALRNRKSVSAVPVGNDDEQIASQITKLLKHNDREEGVPDKLNDAFRGALVTGLNFVHLWKDTREDPVNGKIKSDVVSYDQVMADPFFRNRDLSDCKGILRRTYQTKAGLISIYPKKKKFIEDLSDMGLDDGKFQFMPEAYEYDKKNLLTYDEFYYRTYRTQKLLFDVKSNIAYEWMSDNDEAMTAFAANFEQLIIKKTLVPTVRLITLVGGKVMYDGPNPLGIDDYPFVPVFGYFSPEAESYEWRIQGMVRGLRDAQFLYNRRKAIELDFAESQLNTGFKYKPGALLDPRDIHKTGQGQGLPIKDEAQMTDVEQIRPADIPPGFFQLSENLRNEMMKISGVTEELLGSATDDIAGVLSMMRQGAGLTTLQRLFTNLDFSLKWLGKLRAKAMIKNYSESKIARIIQEQPSPKFGNKTLIEFDIAVEESFDTTTQRQMQFAQMVELSKLGIQGIPQAEFIKTATIQNKDEIIKSIEQQEQMARQQQQQQQQLELLKLQAEIKVANAQATADEGLGIERLSRVQENQQLALERSAQAEENRASARREDEQAVLNMAKALKELESIDMDNFQKFLQVAQLYNQFSDAQHAKDTSSMIRQQYLEQQLRNLQNQTMSNPASMENINSGSIQ